MYAKIINGVEPDELQSVRFPEEVWCVAVESDAQIKRGELLCGQSASGVFKAVSSASDAEKVLVIAAQDFTADAEHTVTSAYAAGSFNREKITISGNSALAISTFEEALRKSNIHLNTLIGAGD